MGFRSTFTTSDIPVTWPKWFKEKYQDLIYFRADGKGTISSKCEAKTYLGLRDLIPDISKCLKDCEFIEDDFLTLVYLHECDGVTKYEIYKNKHISSEPDSWHETEEVEHDYCCDCSKIKQPTKTNEKIIIIN